MSNLEINTWWTLLMNCFTFRCLLCQQPSVLTISLMISIKIAKTNVVVSFICPVLLCDSHHFDYWNKITQCDQLSDFNMLKRLQNLLLEINCLWYILCMPFISCGQPVIICVYVILEFSQFFGISLFSFFTIPFLSTPSSPPALQSPAAAWQVALWQ